MVIGIAGAGTMGRGIAQLGCLGSYATVLHDPDRGALEAGAERLRADLDRGADRGRWSADEAAAASGRLELAGELEGLCGLRARDRGGARGPRAQARPLRPARGGLRPRRRAGHQHILASRRRDRCGRRSSPADLRHALLQPTAADEAGRGRRRGGDERRDARRRIGGRRADGENPDPMQRLAGVHRQPLQPPLRARGASDPRRGRRHTRRDRSRHARGRRLSDGAVRAHGPDRDRRQPRGRAVVSPPAPDCPLGAEPDLRTARRRGQAGA